MNTKLVESLAEAIAALSTEDYALFQEVLIAKMVKKTPGVAGGYACIRDTRIAVWTLISLSKQGVDEAALLLDFPGLTRFDFLAAQVYYQAHQEEIDALIVDHHREDDQADLQHQNLEAEPRPLDLENSPFVGMWKDRPELEDSTAWVRQVREQQWRG